MSLLLTMPNDDSGLLSWLGIVCLKMSWDLKLSSTHHYERLVRAIVHCAGSLKLDYWAFVPHHVWTDPATRLVVRIWQHFNGLQVFIPGNWETEITTEGPRRAGFGWEDAQGRLPLEMMDFTIT